MHEFIKCYIDTTKLEDMAINDALPLEASMPLIIFNFVFNLLLPTYLYLLFTSHFALTKNQNSIFKEGG